MARGHMAKLIAEPFNERMATMNSEGFLVLDRINEVTMMCSREQPIYEHISSFSIALYVLGHFKCADLMSFDDVDAGEAARILKGEFLPIRAEQLPANYNICESNERYLLVLGDPAFPEHFAVLTDAKNAKPYFSKLKFFGSGFDSLKELEDEFLGKDGVARGEIHYFKKISSRPLAAENLGKIYTFRSDGSYAVFEDESQMPLKEEASVSN
jgi:hypothetical protein